MLLDDGEMLTLYKNLNEALGQNPTAAAAATTKVIASAVDFKAHDRFEGMIDAWDHYPGSIKAWCGGTFHVVFDDGRFVTNIKLFTQLRKIKQLATIVAEQQRESEFRAKIEWKA
jgi:hypothetical protein